MNFLKKHVRVFKIKFVSLLKEIRKKNIAVLIFVNFQCFYFFSSITIPTIWVPHFSPMPHWVFSSFYQIWSLFIHTTVVYEEMATVAESLIGPFAFPSIMSFSSCLSHSPLTLKVHFLFYFLLLLLFSNFTCTFSFTFLLIPYLFSISYFFWASAHSPIPFGLEFYSLRLNSKVLNFEWLLDLKWSFCVDFNHLSITNESGICEISLDITRLFVCLLGACWYSRVKKTVCFSKTFFCVFKTLNSFCCMGLLKEFWSVELSFKK